MEWHGRGQRLRGPVEKGAHFYRSLQIDAHGNPIQQTQRLGYARRRLCAAYLPGAADTVHYRMSIPENVGSKITLHARLCYRKFSWFNTQFAFVGEADEKSD